MGPSRRARVPVHRAAAAPVGRDRGRGSRTPLPAIDNETLMVLLTGMLGPRGLRTFELVRGRCRVTSYFLCACCVYGGAHGFAPHSKSEPQQSGQNAHAARQSFLTAPCSVSSPYLHIWRKQFPAGGSARNVNFFVPVAVVPHHACTARCAGQRSPILCVVTWRTRWISVALVFSTNGSQAVQECRLCAGAALSGARSSWLPLQCGAGLVERWLVPLVLIHAHVDVAALRSAHPPAP